MFSKRAAKGKQNQWTHQKYRGGVHLTVHHSQPGWGSQNRKATLCVLTGDPSHEHGDGRRDNSSRGKSSWVTDFLKLSVFNSFKTHVRQSQALMMWTDGGSPSGNCQQEVWSFSLQNSKSFRQVMFMNISCVLGIEWEKGRWLLRSRAWALEFMLWERPAKYVWKSLPSYLEIKPNSFMWPPPQGHLVSGTVHLADLAAFSLSTLPFFAPATLSCLPFYEKVKSIPALWIFPVSSSPPCLCMDSSFSIKHLLKWSVLTSLFKCSSFHHI